MEVTVQPVSGDKLVLGEQFEIIVDFGYTSGSFSLADVNVKFERGFGTDWQLVDVVNGTVVTKVDGTYVEYTGDSEEFSGDLKIKLIATTSINLCYYCIATDEYSVPINFTLSGRVFETMYGDEISFDGMTLFGTHTFYVPDSIVPNFSYTIDDWNSMYANYGVYPRTKTTITGTATGAYGAYIKSIEWRAGTGNNFKVLNSTILEANSEYLTSRINANDAYGYFLWVYVTDSRDRQKILKLDAIKSDLFVDYTEPTVTITDAYRCDENGDASEEGAYGAVIFNAACGHDVSAALANANYSVWYRKANTNDSWVYIIKRDLDGNKSVDSYKAIITLDPNFKYQVAIGVYDGIIPRRLSNSVNILAITAFIEFDKVNNSIGLGGLASGTNALTIALKTKFLSGTDLMIPATACLQASAWAITNGIYTSKFTIDRSTITSIPANASVLISPTPDSYESYCDSGIRVAKIDIPRTLTFICDSVPSENINVNILILKC